MDRGAWWATVRGVTKSWTHTHTHTHRHTHTHTHTHILSWKIKQYNGLSSWLDHPVLHLGSLGMLLVSFPSFHTESLASVYSFLLMDGLKGFKLHNSIYIYIYIFFSMKMFTLPMQLVSMFLDSIILLEKEMATHSSVLAWRIPGTREPDGLPSMGSHRVGHDWSDTAAAAAYYWITGICI